MDFFALFQQNWQISLVIGIVIIGSFIFNIHRMQKTKALNLDFLARHPDAAKIYLSAKALIASEAVNVQSVNGGAPQIFYEKGKTGFYIAPGKSAVELIYTRSRPGVLYRNVTESTGVVKKEIETEPGGCYKLGYDRKEKAFTFGSCAE
ncbi:MAG: hypothetical protein LBO80_11275 [Treponema sp.]|jgi:hypothetical protein|nr:hypothetical protein [Treponema sp.]